jgi:hypothetical protein
MGGLAVSMIAGLVAAGAGVLVVLCLVGVAFAIRRLRRAEGDVAAMIWAIRGVVGFLLGALLLSLGISIVLDTGVPGFVPALLVASVIAIAVLPILALAAAPLQGAWDRAVAGRARRKAAARGQTGHPPGSNPSPPPPPFPPRPPMPPMPPSGGGLAP